MANEARVTSSLYLRKASATGLVLLEYQSRPSSFQADVSGTKGPSPGAVTVARTGTTIDLSQLTTPGFCVIQNLDATYMFEYGIFDPSINSFFPLGECGPGEVYTIKLSRNLLREYPSPGTGTGTTGEVNELRAKAEWGAGTAGIAAVFSAFEA